HPSVFSFSTQNAAFTAANEDDGTGVHYEIKLEVTDPQGLPSDTARVNIWPEVDLNPSAVTVTPDPPAAQQTAQYAFTIRNAGRMPAPISHWVLRAGNTLVGQGDVIVPPLDSVAVSVSAALPTSGNFT